MIRLFKLTKLFCLVVIVSSCQQDSSIVVDQGGQLDEEAQTYLDTIISEYRENYEPS